MGGMSWRLGEGGKIVTRAICGFFSLSILLSIRDCMNIEVIRDDIAQPVDMDGGAASDSA